MTHFPVNFKRHFVALLLTFSSLSVFQVAVAQENKDETPAVIILEIVSEKQELKRSKEPAQEKEKAAQLEQRKAKAKDTNENSRKSSRVKRDGDASDAALAQVLERTQQELAKRTREVEELQRAVAERDAAIVQLAHQINELSERSSAATAAADEALLARIERIEKELAQLLAALRIEEEPEPEIDQAVDSGEPPPPLLEEPPMKLDPSSKLPPAPPPRDVAALGGVGVVEGEVTALTPHDGKVVLRVAQWNDGKRLRPDWVGHRAAIVRGAMPEVKVGDRIAIDVRIDPAQGFVWGGKVFEQTPASAER
jgi:hypothetical protein